MCSNYLRVIACHLVLVRRRSLHTRPLQRILLRAVLADARHGHAHFHAILMNKLQLYSVYYYAWKLVSRSSVNS